MINPADDEPGGALDEAAERAAFAEAVAEWRRADAEAAATGTKKPLVIEREYITGPSKPAAKAAAGTGTSTTFGEEAGGMSMWKNPFAPPTRDDDKEVRFFECLCSHSLSFTFTGMCACIGIRHG